MQILQKNLGKLLEVSQASTQPQHRTSLRTPALNSFNKGTNSSRRNSTSSRTDLWLLQMLYLGTGGPNYVLCNAQQTGIFSRCIKTGFGSLKSHKITSPKLRRFILIMSLYNNKKKTSQIRCTQDQKLFLLKLGVFFS